MPIILIKTLSPSILLLSLIGPVLTGFLGKKLGVSISLGWILCVLSFLFQDVFSLMLASRFHGADGVRAVAVEQPGTAAALFAGWVLPLIGHFIGRGFRRLHKRVFRRGSIVDSEHVGDGKLDPASS